MTPLLYEIDFLLETELSWYFANYIKKESL